METLNTQQIAFVASELQKTGLQYATLEEELLDHLCCDIELQMKEGLTFQQAKQATFQTFEKEKLKQIEEQTILSLNQNKLIMKQLTLLTLGILLTVVTCVWASEQEPPSISPLAGDFQIVGSFGPRIHPVFKLKKQHKGVDIKAPIGTPVLATSNGIIVKAVIQEKGYGLHIMIQHDEHFSTFYCHLSRIDVVEGQKVKQGEVIGAVGTTGMATAPHLHYEVLKDGENVDPEEYFEP